MSSEYAKGEKPRDLDAAKGGSVLGRTRSFMKEEDQFRAAYHGDKAGPGDVTGDISEDDNKYAKSGIGAGKGEVPPPPARKSKVIK